MAIVVRISSSCRRAMAESDPKWHEDCATGPSPWHAGDKNTCACSCHDAMRELLARTLASGLSIEEIRQLWAWKIGVNLNDDPA